MSDNPIFSSVFMCVSFTSEMRHVKRKQINRNINCDRAQMRMHRIRMTKQMQNDRFVNVDVRIFHYYCLISAIESEMGILIKNRNEH